MIKMLFLNVIIFVSGALLGGYSSEYISNNKYIEVHELIMDGISYEAIGFHDRVVIYLSDGTLSYYDKSTMDPTFHVIGGGIGISYAILNNENIIIGSASDLEQDGLIDSRAFYNEKRLEVNIGGRGN